MQVQVNAIIRVTGEAGTFRVTGIRPNGDIDAWGGNGGHLSVRLVQGQASSRTFAASRCRIAKLSAKTKRQNKATLNRVGAR